VIWKDKRWTISSWIRSVHQCLFLSWKRFLRITRYYFAIPYLIQIHDYPTLPVQLPFLLHLSDRKYDIWQNTTKDQLLWDTHPYPLHFIHYKSSLFEIDNNHKECLLVTDSLKSQHLCKWHGKITTQIHPKRIRR